MSVRSASWIVLGLALVSIGAPASAQTFDATNRGWFNSVGSHTATNLTAYVGQGSGSTRFRSFFVFDLTGLSEPVGGAVLRLELEAYLGPDPSEAFAVYDVSSNVGDLLLTQSGRTDIYTDLGSGTAYAMGVATPADVGSVLEIPLSDEAVAAVNAAAGGRFAVGVSLETLRLPTGSEGIRFSLTTEPRVHQLVLSAPVPPPTPPTLAIAPALAGMVPPSELAVTAQLVDAGGVPVAGAPVDFSITSGPHAGLVQSAVTDAAGSASFAYVGSVAGVDEIVASLADGSSGAPQAQATAVWDADCNANAIPDACDLACDGWGGACSGFAGCGASLDADANGEPDECFVAPPPPEPPANAAPDCSAAVASAPVLTRPDLRFRAVSIDGVTDADGDPLAIVIDDVAQDERAQGRGRRWSCPDAVGLGTQSVMLRAERLGFGDGRVYHLDFTAEDGKGGVCEGSVEVCVPRDNRRRGASCVDQGALYDSQTCQRWDPRRHHGHHHGHGKGRH
jgi:hypothetical protein